MHSATFAVRSLREMDAQLDALLNLWDAHRFGNGPIHLPRNWRVSLYLGRSLQWVGPNGAGVYWWMMPQRETLNPNKFG